MKLSRFKRRLRDASEIADLDSTSRRYFVLGAFDGTLIVLGVILGAIGTGAGEEQITIVLYGGLSAAIALSVSSAVGAYEAERVEKLLSMAGVEKALLADIGERQARIYRFAAMVSALVHAAAPLIASAVPLLPFVIIPDVSLAAIVSTAVTLGVLFILGAYLGNLVKERIFMTGMRFVVTGLGTATILYALGMTQ